MKPRRTVFECQGSTLVVTALPAARPLQPQPNNGTSVYSSNQNSIHILESTQARICAQHCGRHVAALSLTRTFSSHKWRSLWTVEKLKHDSHYKLGYSHTAVKSLAFLYLFRLMVEPIKLSMSLDHHSGNGSPPKASSMAIITIEPSPGLAQLQTFMLAASTVSATFKSLCHRCERL